MNIWPSPVDTWSQIALRAIWSASRLVVGFYHWLTRLFTAKTGTIRAHWGDGDDDDDDDDIRMKPPTGRQGPTPLRKVIGMCHCAYTLCLPQYTHPIQLSPIHSSHTAVPNTLIPYSCSQYTHPIQLSPIHSSHTAVPNTLIPYSCSQYTHPIQLFPIHFGNNCMGWVYWE